MNRLTLLGSCWKHTAGQKYLTHISLYGKNTEMLSLVLTEGLSEGGGTGNTEMDREREGRETGEGTKGARRTQDEVGTGAGGQREGEEGNSNTSAKSH